MLLRSSENRLAPLTPKQCAGRIRRAVKVQASLAMQSSSAFMGQRVARVAPVSGAVRRAAGRNGLVVRPSH